MSEAVHSAIATQWWMHPTLWRPGDPIYNPDQQRVHHELIEIQDDHDTALCDDCEDPEGFTWAPWMDPVDDVTGEVLPVLATLYEEADRDR